MKLQFISNQTQSFLNINKQYWKFIKRFVDAKKRNFKLLYKLSHTSGYQETGLQDAEIQNSYYFVDTGMIASNVYLYAASEGLATWFHNCDKPALAIKLALRTDQRVLFGQTVGYPAKK